MRTKIKVFAFDKNRNNSSITRSVFELEKTKKSLFNIPIVAKYSSSEDKFGNQGDLEGHNPYLSTDNDGNPTIKQDTFPIGVVSSDANISFEDINEGTEENPDFKTYVTVDNVYLWKRYDATQKIQGWLHDGVEPKVSMEIGKVEGNFSEEGYFNISSFEFEAIAALGSDVEPCFPQAKIESYSVQSFDDSFFEMINELKVSLNNENDIHNDAEPEQKGENILKNKADIAAQFSLTMNQLSEEMSRALGEVVYETTDWYGDTVERNRFYLNDFDSVFVYATDRMEDYIDVKIPYSMNGDNVLLNVDGIKRIKYVPTDWEGSSDEVELEVNFSKRIVEELKSEFDKLVAERNDITTKHTEKETALLSMSEQFTSLQEQITTKDNEIEVLKNFKNGIEEVQRKERVESLFATYAKQLSKEEIEELRSKEVEFTSIELFEKEIKAFVCDKLIANFKPQTASFSRMGVITDSPDPNVSTNVWDRLENKNKD